MTVLRDIDCWERMAEVIREVGFIPLFRCSVDGWSIQDRTAVRFWFEDEDGDLGPWDWKVDVVREGDIAYGKFLGGKAAFATREWYAHLMNWRRSIPKYRMAEGKRFKAVTKSDKVMKKYSPAALSAIRQAGSMGSKELRMICSALGEPVKKNTMDSVMAFLQMGTWSVVGDIQRVFNGPDLSYKGWQIASNTTPEALFGLGMETHGAESSQEDMPSWARHLSEPEDENARTADCTPEESRRLLVAHVREMFPEADVKVLEKLI